MCFGIISFCKPDVKLDILCLNFGFCNGRDWKGKLWLRDILFEIELSSRTMTASFQKTNWQSMKIFKKPGHLPHAPLTHFLLRKTTGNWVTSCKRTTFLLKYKAFGMIKKSSVFNFKGSLQRVRAYPTICYCPVEAKGHLPRESVHTELRRATSAFIFIQGLIWWSSFQLE